MGNGVRGVSPGPRMRVSAWVDPVVFMNGTRKDITLPDGKVLKDVFIPDRNNLFKPALVDAAVVNGTTVIDDISLLVTINDDNTDKLGIGFDTALLKTPPPPGATVDDRRKLREQDDAVREQFFNQVIKHCHEVLGTQCLIGYANTFLTPHTRTKPDGTTEKVEAALARWLKMDNPVPSVDDVTTRIAAFCEKHLPDFDGVSFDLEGLSGTDKQFETTRRNLMGLYIGLAEKLRDPPFPKDPDPAQRPDFVKNRGFDRLVAFASGNLIGVEPNPDGTNDGTMKSSRRLKHAPNGEILRDPNNPDEFVSATAPLTASFAERAQDYQMAISDRNLIVRPMSYDNFLRTDGNGVLDDWHADIVRFMDSLRVKARDGSLVQTGSFQLGLKTIDGPGQQDHDLTAAELANPPPKGLLTPDGKKRLGMDGVMGGVGASNAQREQHIRQRCANLLNPHRIGVCLFPTSAQYWRAANEALNPNTPEAGKMPGMPVQCALSPEAIARLKR